MMKKFITILLLFALSNIYSQKRVIISGEIKNSSNDNNVSIIINNPYEASNSQSYKGKVDSKGKFRIDIPLSKSSTAFLRTSSGTLGLIITPNDSVHCTFSSSNMLNKIRFEGKNSNQYNYFVKYLNEFGDQHGYFFKSDYSDVFNMDPIQFKKYRQEKVEKDLAFLKEYSNNNLISEDFKTFAEVEIKYSYYYGLLSYHSFKKNFKKIEEQLPDDFYNEINDTLFKHDEYLYSDNYIQATRIYVSLLNVGTYTTPNSYFPKAMSVSSELLSGKTLFSYQLITLSRMLQTDASSTLKDSLISSFLQKCPYNEYNSVITNNYKKNIEASKKNIPNNILESKFETVEGKEITFRDMLKNFKNKVIYIDVWASWCGPCKVEMPSSMALKDKFKNEDVVFIYFSIDKNEAAWKKAIDNWKISGIHYLHKEGIESIFSKHFNIIGIPHYILLDKNGQTIFPSAVRPSSKSIESSIRTLL